MEPQAIPPPIAAALVAIQKELHNPKANQTAQVKTEKGNFSYDYADLDTILKEIRPIASSHGLAISFDPVTSDRLITVHLDLIHESGASLRSSMSWASPTDIQKAGGVITYLRRYLLAARLGIAIDKDDDGNDAAGNKAVTAPRSVSRPAREQPPTVPVVAQVRGTPPDPAQVSGDQKPGLEAARAALRTAVVAAVRRLGAPLPGPDDVDTLERAIFKKPIAHLDEASVLAETPKFQRGSDALAGWLRTRLNAAGLMPDPHNPMPARTAP